MHVHFVAVAGTGMGTLAGLFRAAGHEVSGSDTAFHPPMGPALAGWGIRLLQGFDPAHLDPRPDLVVVGNVCRATNVEALAARERGIPVTTMPHALAEHLLGGTSPLVVAGTHGKTTTTAMCAWILKAAGREPGLLVGGLPKNFEASFLLPGRSRVALPQLGEAGPLRRVPFVIEGDEYDTAYFEKTPKMWHYRPEVGIVTSVEHDHVDIYPDEASYHAAFRGFVARIPASGLLVAAAHDEAAASIASASSRAELAWFALEGDELRGRPPHWLGALVAEGPTGQVFDLFVGGVAAGRVALRMPGRHNVRNALAALGATVQGYGVPLPEAVAALASFEGVRRRQDLLFTARGVRVYDDFAHHPTAVAETVRALRARHAEGALWIAFEPRSATACRAMHQAEYARAFDGATHVLLAPVGRSEIPAAERLDLTRLAAELRAGGIDASAPATLDALVDALAGGVADGDTVALLSNGPFGGVAKKLQESLA